MFRRPSNHRHSAIIQRTRSPVSEERPPVSTPAQSNIEVCVRMRPLLESHEDEVVWEIDESNNTIKSTVDNMEVRSLNLAQPRSFNDLSNFQRFAYDNVVGPGVKTKEIYTKLFKKIVDSVVQGYNGTIFMYGQTTSGKTYTMLGNQKDPGVLPHSLRTIFMSAAKMKDYKFQISVSYLELYNEQINDLLEPENQNLKVVDDVQYGIAVKGLKKQEVESFEDAIYLMSFGEENRKYRETNRNEHSSRSHTIYQVYIESTQQIEGGGHKKRLSLLNLVDLAGSERLSDNGGITDLQTGETGHINKSLFLLTNVIKRLADGKTFHIPYRDSKLTRILSNALGGNSLTAVVCTISPALVNYAQTLSTLRFASRAKKVKNDPTVNLVDEGNASKLKEELRNLRQKLSLSQNQITQVNSLNVKLEGNLHSTRGEIQVLQKEMEELRTLFAKEVSRLQMSDVSSTSLLDIIEPINSPLRTSAKKITLATSQTNLAAGGAQSAEAYFGDNVLTAIEQLIQDASALKTLGSIDTLPPDNVDLKEWTTQCLAAKNSYLRDLKELQKKYGNSISEITQRLLSRNMGSELDAQLKSLTVEVEKVESVQSKINSAVKKLNPGMRKDLERPGSLVLAKTRSIDEQPIQNGDFVDILDGEKEPNEATLAHLKLYYEEVLKKMEKKYDEICDLVTSNVSRSNMDSMNMSFDKSRMQSPPPERTTNILSEGSSPLKSPGRLLDSSIKHSRTNSEERSGSRRNTMRPRLESVFSRLRQDRGAISVFPVNNEACNAFLWGSGKDGRLGTGKFTNESSPTSIRDLKFTKIACGYHNTFGISNDGLTYGWGRNENGQLGIGNNFNSPIPINLTALNKVTITDIACGWQHSLALTSDGRVFSWGCSDEGQLGHGDNFEQPSPIEIQFFDNNQILKIACGHSQSAAVTADGNLYTWGHNSDCRLMISNTRSHFIPTLTELHELKTGAEGEDELEIVSISMGASHMLVATKSGRVFTAGRGNEGQLGQRLVKGMPHSIVIKPDPESNEYHEDIICCAILELDSSFGDSNKAVMVACGEKFSLVLTEKQEVYSFGDSSDGCLGIKYDESHKNIFEPSLIDALEGKEISIIEAGPRHAACISKYGELYCWGFNYYDQVEVGGTSKNYHIPKKVDKSLGGKVTGVSCGYFHTASIVL